MQWALCILFKRIVFIKINVLPLVAFSPFDKIHKYKYSGKRISQIQDELECGFIQQWLNFF